MKKLGRPKKEKQEYKKCIKCKKLKGITEFYTTSSRCRPCHNEVVKKNQKKKKHYYNQYRTKYALKHPEKKAEWRAAFLKRWENENGIKYKEYVKDRIKKKIETDPKYAKYLKDVQKKYRLKNRDRISKKRKNHYLKNIESERARSLAYYHANKEQQKISQQIRKAKEYLAKVIGINNEQKIKKYVDKLNRLFAEFEKIKS